MDDAVRRFRERRQRRLDSRWEESDHPRDKSGRFSSTNGMGGSAGRVSSSTKEAAERHNIRIDKRVRTAREDSNSENINPKFGTGKDYNLNCGYCCIAYELKRRGMDVEAAPKQWMKKNEFIPLFDGFKWEPISAKRKESAKKELEESVLKMGDGARGIVFSLWEGRNSGHFFNFEVENGKVLFLDCQSGDDADEFFERLKPSKLTYARMDNLEIRDSIFDCVRGKSDDKGTGKERDKS